MTNTIVLKQKIADSGYKYSYLAEQLGISRQALSMKVNNASEFRINEVKILCKILGITKLTEMEAIFFN